MYSWHEGEAGGNQASDKYSNGQAGQQRNPLHVYISDMNQTEAVIASMFSDPSVLRYRSPTKQHLRPCLDVVGFPSIHMYWGRLEWNLN